MSRHTAVVLAAVMVCSALAMPAVAAAPQQDGPADQKTAPTGDDIDPEEFEEVADIGYEDISADLRPLSEVDPSAAPTDVDDEYREAASEGARTGATLAQAQGVQVSQEQRQAAVEAAVLAASQRQDVTVEQVQSAATGAAHGALVQSQSVNVTQIQAGVFGGTAGALSQSQTADVRQLQSAAYGGTHGALAQHQRANVTQLQAAAVGAAAGGAHGAARASDEARRPHASKVTEAAQGGAYGSLTQVQNVSVVQIQAAAFGAAGGGAEKSHDADPKKVQEASMGAAKGTVEQTQEVTVRQRQRADGGDVEQVQTVRVEQIQAATRGAAKGSLTQVQRVTVSQIQRVASGAAGGALSQYQRATVVQIQSAATGAAHGTVRQTQTVEVVQIQSAAAGAASGAARSAAQQQVVNVRQIQAAAAGAGQGAVTQIQRVDVRQVQAIADSAAGGALSQYQQATVVQIQSAARGACEGAVSLVQVQEVTIQQIQVLTERAAGDTAATAAAFDIRNEVSITTYARSRAAQPAAPDTELRGLFFASEAETVFLANPNDVAVTVTVTSDAGETRTVTLSPGESLTSEFDPGSYTLTAATAEGESVRIAGRDRLAFSVGEALDSLRTAVDEQRGTLSVTNPNAQRVTVTVFRGGAVETTFQVPANWEVTRPLERGEYTLTAEAGDGRSVPVDGESARTITVEPPVDLDVAVEDRSITVTNPSSVDARAVLTGPDGSEQAIDVPAESTRSRTVSPGEYRVTGESAAGQDVRVDGQTAVTVTVTAEPIALTVAVDDETVTVENPGDTTVTITATRADGETQTLTVPANETSTVDLAPGNYTLSGSAADDRAVLLNGSQQLDVTVEEPSEGEPRPLAVTPGVGNLTVTNPNDEPVTVTATREDGDAPPDDTGDRDVEVPANETVTVDVEPGEYTLTAETADGRTVPLDGREALTVTVDAPDDEGAVDTCTVVDSAGVYELTEDIDGETTDGPCITIRASDVTLDGNGHTVAGPGVGDTAGIAVSNESQSVANVTVRDVRVENWGPGVAVGQPATEASVGDVQFRNVEVAGSGADGVALTATDGAAFENVTVAGSDEAGFRLAGTTGVDLTDVTTAGNGGDGLTLVEGSADTEVARLTATDNAGSGLRIGDDSAVERTDITGAYIANNSEVGVVLAGQQGTAISDVVVEANGEVGIAVVSGAAAGTATLSNATVRGHDGPEVRTQAPAGEPGLTATDLTVDTAATVAFADEPVTLDALDSAAFPDLPENASDAGPGLNVSGIADEIEVAVPLDSIEVGSDEQAELWRYDGTAWRPVENTSVDADAEAIEASLGTDGLYAPVAVSEDEPTSLNVSVDGQNVTIENPNDVAVVVTAANDTGDRQAEVPAAERLVAALAPGEYTFTATTVEGTPVPVNGEDELTLTVAAPEPESLNVTVGNRAVWVANPRADPVTVTVSNETGVVVRTPREPGENASVSGLDPGEYTLAATDQTGDPVPVNGDATVEFALPPDLRSLALSTDDGPTVTNPNEVGVTVAVENETGVVATVDIGPAATEPIPAEGLAPGDYTLSAATADDRRVPVEGEWTTGLTVEAPELTSLAATADDGTVTVENPNEVAVIVTVTSRAGEQQQVRVAGGEAVTADLGPGEYALTAETEDGRAAEIDGQAELRVTIDPDLESVEVDTADGSVQVRNPNDVPVTVTIAGPERQQVLGLEPGDSATVALAAGEYTVTAETVDGEPVPVNGQERLEVTVEDETTDPTPPAPPEEPAPPEQPEPEPPDPAPPEPEPPQPVPPEPVPPEQPDPVPPEPPGVGPGPADGGNNTTA